jgi:hypothetical protein
MSKVSVGDGGALVPDNLGADAVKTQQPEAMFSAEEPAQKFYYLTTMQHSSHIHSDTINLNAVTGGVAYGWNTYQDNLIHTHPEPFTEEEANTRYNLESSKTGIEAQSGGSPDLLSAQASKQLMTVTFFQQPEAQAQDTGDYVPLSSLADGFEGFLKRYARESERAILTDSALQVWPVIQSMPVQDAMRLLKANAEFLLSPTECGTWVSVLARTQK